jgi:hypothetical protein
MRRLPRLLFLLAAFFIHNIAFGQLDPERRELVEVGSDQALKGADPLDGYSFYYVNEPNYFKTNVTFRMALAPVYVDTETGFVGLLGPNTDFGLGLAGGGFADDYYEFDKGKYFPEQSFYGHVLEISGSVYHLFNPNSRVPLSGVFRLKEHYSVYSRDDTGPGFTLPADHSTISWRAGLRWGGRPPVLHPDVAMELSAWYEGQYRTDSGGYGFADDRSFNSHADLFWARALLIYTLKNGTAFDVNLTAGGSVDVDRFSAYRLGGNLPVGSEFPLTIPGYFDYELSARDFVDFTAQYTIPLDVSRRWSITPVASAATVDYAPGLEQSGHFNSGAGLDLNFKSSSDVWEVTADGGYGFEAIRSSGRGGESIGILIQLNLGVRHPIGPSKLDNVGQFLQDHF